MRKSRLTAVIVILALLGGMFSSSFSTLKVQAKTTKELINEKEKEKKELTKKLNEQKGDLKDLKDEKKSLQNQLKALNDDMLQVSEHLEELEGKITVKTEEIEVTQAALEEAIATEEWQHECMMIRVRMMYERNESDYITSLLHAGSFGNLLNLATWFEKIENYDKDKLHEYEQNREFIDQTKERLLTEKQELDQLKLEAEVEKSRLAGMISQVSVNIADYADQIEEAEKKALAYEAELKQKEADLKELKQKLEEELRLSWAAANAKWRDISEVTFSDGDRKILANIIYCEAGAEPYEGKLAVASVVINRVRSSKFPDSVVGVVYQRNQFSPVGSGRMDLALAADKANAACYQAADEAMQGTTNVGNCVFFRTPVPGLTGINIGGHVFY